MKKAPCNKRVAATAKKYPVRAGESGVAERVSPRLRPVAPPRGRKQLDRPHRTNAIGTIAPSNPARQIEDPEPDNSFQRDAIGLFIAIADQWRLTIPQRLTILGKPPSSTSTYHHWKHAVADHKPIQDNPDLIDRIAYVVGIFENAGRFWGTPERAMAWLTESNKALVFHGQSPLAKMLEGRMDDLRQTCVYIEGAAEGAW
jgi:hypothetical protein